MSSNSIVIKAGQTVVLPSDVVVTGLFLIGSVSVNSTCNNLPEATPSSCFVFSWETNATPAFADAYFSHIMLTDTFSYVIPTPEDPFFASNQYEDGGSEAEKLAQTIFTIPNFAGEVIAWDQAGGPGLRQIKIRLPDFGILPRLRLVQPLTGASQIMYIEAVKDANCGVPGGWTEF